MSRFPRLGSGDNAEPVGARIEMFSSKGSPALVHDFLKQGILPDMDCTLYLEIK
ncbi:hypothetical protein [Azospirillum argentinense]